VRNINFNTPMSRFGSADLGPRFPFLPPGTLTCLRAMYDLVAEAAHTVRDSVLRLHDYRYYYSRSGMCWLQARGSYSQEARYWQRAKSRRLPSA